MTKATLELITECVNVFLEEPIPSLSSLGDVFYLAKFISAVMDTHCTQEKQKLSEEIQQMLKESFASSDLVDVEKVFLKDEKEVGKLGLLVIYISLICGDNQKRIKFLSSSTLERSNELRFRYLLQSIQKRGRGITRTFIDVLLEEEYSCKESSKFQSPVPPKYRGSPTVYTNSPRAPSSPLNELLNSPQFQMQKQLNEKIKELRTSYSQIQSLESENQELIVKNENITKKYSKLERDISSMKSKHSELQTHCESLETQFKANLDGDQNTILNLRKENKTLKLENDMTHAECSRISEENNELSSKIENLRTHLTLMRGDRDKLTEELIHHRQASDDNGTLIQIQTVELKAVKSQLEELQCYLSDVRQTRAPNIEQSFEGISSSMDVKDSDAPLGEDMASAVVDKLLYESRLEVESLIIKISEMESDHSILEKEKEYLINKMKESTTSINLLKEKNNEYLSEQKFLEEKQEMLLTEVENVISQLKASEEIFKKEKENYENEKKLELSRCEAKQQELVCQHAVEKSKIEQHYLEKEKEITEVVEKELASSEEKLTKKENELAEMCQKNLEIQQSLSESDRLIAELNYEHSAKLSDLEQNFIEKEKNLIEDYDNKLNSNAEMLKQRGLEIQEIKDNIHKLERDLAESSGKNANLISEHNTKITTMEENFLKKEKKLIDGYNSNFNMKNVALSQKENELKELNLKLAKLEEDLANCVKQKSDFDNELNAELAKIEQDFQSKEKELKECTNKLTEKSEQLQKLETLLYENKQKLQTTEHDLAESHKQKSQLDNELKLKLDEIEQMQQDFVQIEEKLTKDYEDKLAHSAGKLRQTESELAQVKQKMLTSQVDLEESTRLKVEQLQEDHKAKLEEIRQDFFNKEKIIKENFEIKLSLSAESVAKKESDLAQIQKKLQNLEQDLDESSRVKLNLAKEHDAKLSEIKQSFLGKEKIMKDNFESKLAQKQNDLAQIQEKLLNLEQDLDETSQVKLNLAKENDAKLLEINQDFLIKEKMMKDNFESKLAQKENDLAQIQEKLLNVEQDLDETCQVKLNLAEEHNAKLLEIKQDFLSKEKIMKHNFESKLANKECDLAQIQEKFLNLEQDLDETSQVKLNLAKKEYDAKLSEINEDFLSKEKIMKENFESKLCLSAAELAKRGSDLAQIQQKLMNLEKDLDESSRVKFNLANEHDSKISEIKQDFLNKEKILIENYEEKLSLTAQNLTQKESQLIQTQQEMQIIQQNFVDSNRHKAELISEHNIKLSEIEKDFANKQNDSTQKHEKELAILTEKLNQKQKDLELYQQKILKLEKDLSNALRQTAEHEQDNIILKESIDAHKKQINEKYQESVNLEKQLDALGRTVAELEESREEKEQKIIQLAESLTNTTTTLEKEYKNKTEELCKEYDKKLKENVDKVNEEKAGITDNMKQILGEVEEKEKKINLLEQQLQINEENKTRAENEIKELNEAFNKTEKEANKTHGQEVMELNKQMKTMKTKEEMEEKFKEVNETWQKKLDEQERKLEDLQKATFDDEEKDNLIKEREKELREAEARLIDAEKEASAAKEEVMRVERESEKTIQSLKGNLKSIKEKSQSDKQMFMEMKRTCKAKIEEITVQLTKRKEEDEKNEIILFKYEAAKQKLKETVKKQKEAETTREKYKEQAQHFKEQLKQLTEDRGNEKETVIQQHARIEKLEQERQPLKEKLKEMENVCKRSAVEKRALAAQLKMADSTIRDMRRQSMRESISITALDHLKRPCSTSSSNNDEFDENDSHTPLIPNKRIRKVTSMVTLKGGLVGAKKETKDDEFQKPTLRSYSRLKIQPSSSDSPQPQIHYQKRVESKLQKSVSHVGMRPQSPSEIAVNRPKRSASSIAAVKESLRRTSRPTTRQDVPRIEVEVSNLPSSTSSTKSQGYSVPRDMMRSFHCDEEEGEFNNHKFLSDLQVGKCQVDSKNFDWRRVSELQRRNSLYPPHMRSAYPAEMQFQPSSAFTDDQLREGQAVQDDLVLNLTEAAGHLDINSPPCFNLRKRKSHSDSLSSQSSLTGSVGRKAKRLSTTSYSRPGPPTPGRRGSGKGHSSETLNKSSLSLESTSSRASKWSYDFDLKGPPETPGSARTLRSLNQSSGSNTGSPSKLALRSGKGRSPAIRKIKTPSSVKRLLKRAKSPWRKLQNESIDEDSGRPREGRKLVSRLGKNTKSGHN